MFDKLKVLSRAPFRGGPVHLFAGDVMCLRTTNSVTGETRVLLSRSVTKAGAYTEGVIFEAEVEGRHAIGGAFIEQETEA
jgi:hypothetical protein